MKKYPPLIVGAVAATVVGALVAGAHAATPKAQTPHDRAVAIVAKMTVDEKISQLHGIKTSTEYRTVPAIPRLGIPKLLLTNGPAGVSTGGLTQPSATALPAPIALAASWDLLIRSRHVLHALPLLEAALGSFGARRSPKGRGTGVVAASRDSGGDHAPVLTGSASRP